MTPTEPSFKTYLFQYYHDGAWWHLEIKAPSREDAEARLKKLPWAQLCGEVAATVPVYFGPLVKLFCWLKNLKRRTSP